jgi:ArsR family transcriptional regulator
LHPEDAICIFTQIAKEVLLDPSTRSRLETRARVIKALAHPTRLLVVEELSEGRSSVGELAAAAACDISTMSRHLAVLRGAGLVSVEKAANTVLCRLATPCVTDFFACVDRVIAGDPDPCGASCGERG